MEMRWLVVDLDGTVLQSDMLLESFWHVMSRNPAAAFQAVWTFRNKDKAALKRTLAQHSDFDFSHLPYDSGVIDLIKTHREAGGRVALVTASDQGFAQAIADYLGCFDEVHGSDGARNLKGAAKAAFLTERFGEGGFDYAGDAAADLPVWAQAQKAITVGLAQSVKPRVVSAGGEVQHLKQARPKSSSALPPAIKAMRPHQWLKNLLICLPALASHDAGAATWLAVVLAFIAMSLVASSVYIFNDLLDLSVDRGHVRKRERPLAAGTLSLEYGTVLGPLLFLSGLLIALLFMRYEFVLVLLGYFALTLAYSMVLKRQLIIDICVLAGLYTARVIAGAMATGIYVSPWLLALSVFLFLSLAAVKRQAELVSDAALGREGSSGRAYVTGDTPIVASMALSSGYIAVLVVALYISTPGLRSLYETPAYLWGICPVLLFWISRVVMITHRGLMDDDPVVFAMKDHVSRGCAVVIGGLLLAAATL
jgi:4-hydroxybenzoate polyprenyltransferase/phosphoserine phosphatase